MFYEKKVLKNGLRVISIPEENSLATTILVLTETGSKYETKEINGLSHFLEHMCFKGTENRPKALDISSELDSMGAQYNAFTSRECTGYYAKVQPEFFDRALDVVSDIYLNSIFDAKEIEKEKGVIVEEINMYEDLPQHKVQELIMKVVYGDQPAGWDIAGKKDIVKKLVRDDFTKHRKEHYVASSSMVVVAGKFDKDSVYKKIEKAFSNIHDGKKSEKLSVKEIQGAPEILVQEKKSDQTHFVLAVRGFGANDDKNYAMEVLSAILGGGMSSRLFQKIREEMGAAYYVRSANDYYTDHGLLQVSAGVNHEKAEDVIKAVLEEFKKMKNDLTPERELKMVKDMLVGNMFLGLETSDSIASFFGGQEIVKKKIITPEEIGGRIKGVSAEDVRNAAREVFVEKNLNLALIGPFKDGERFAKILTL